jgi:hypothetical protein
MVEQSSEEEYLFELGRFLSLRDAAADPEFTAAHAA